MIKPLGEAWGIKYTEKKSESKVLPDDLYVDEVLERIGGKGMMINSNGK